MGKQKKPERLLVTAADGRTYECAAASPWLDYVLARPPGATQYNWKLYKQHIVATTKLED
jgi:hypothetical protein